MGEDYEQKQILEHAIMQYAKNNRDSDSLKERLDTEGIKLKIATYLTGTMIVETYDEKTQTRKKEVKSVGVRKVNQLGFQDIMSFVEAVVNKAVVQGNFPEIQDAYDYLIRIRKSFTIHLWINSQRFGIDVQDFRGILNEIFALIEPFMTRTIKDGERSVTRDTTVQQDRIIRGDRGLNFNPMKMFTGR